MILFLRVENFEKIVATISYIRVRFCQLYIL